MIIRPSFLIHLLIFIVFGSCVQKKDSPKVVALKEEKITKINGVSFVASRDSVNQKNIAPLLTINANYAAIMPFGFIKNLEHPELNYNSERQWFGESVDGVAQYVKLLHKNNIKVMMKPQIWIWRGEFTGEIEMKSEEAWLQLENSYSNFILDYAILAEQEKIEIFCIGTELERFIEHRPNYWQELISQVRKVYSGKLTYAANWDEYKRVPFWEALNYIGIDAYFPISESKTSRLEESKLGWERWKNEMKTFSETKNKKILFTEYGYRSVDFSGKEPWKSDREMYSVNLEAQTNLLEGLYQSVWEEEWFAGGFLWKWFIDHEKEGGEKNSGFTPQNKPAQEIIQKYYSQD